MLEVCVWNLKSLTKLKIDMAEPKPKYRKVQINYHPEHVLHKSGAEQFGGAWLSANMGVVDHCRTRVDISDPAVKELLTLAVMSVLLNLKRDGHLK